jgi:hypothetical protein
MKENVTPRMELSHLAFKTITNYFSHTIQQRIILKKNSNLKMAVIGKNILILNKKLEAPRSLYSSPGYNNNISQ